MSVIGSLLLHEEGKMYRAILNVYQRRLLLEKMPQTPGIQAHIEELKELETKLKKMAADKKFISKLASIAIKEVMVSDRDYKAGQAIKAQKPRTIKGITPDQRNDRNNKIISHFQEATASGKITLEGFAKKYAKKYDVSPRQIKRIINK